MHPLILKPNWQPNTEQIQATNKIMLVGSCFTEHIGKAIAEVGIHSLQNPNGILFDPLSISRCITQVIDQPSLQAKDSFLLNEVYNNWDYHSSYSQYTKEELFNVINQSRKAANQFLKNADWLIITLGTAFNYTLTELGAAQTGNEQNNPVANCHRAPSQWFNKQLLTIEEIKNSLDVLYHRLRLFNPNLKIIFTISPVRHIADGIVENTQSKARLIEVVHHFCKKFESVYYFPAYEIVIDVLRDYRFFAEDMVHPNYLATDTVMEYFMNLFYTTEAKQIVETIQQHKLLLKHKPRFENTAAHKKFLESTATKTMHLQTQFPFLHWENIIEGVRLKSNMQI
jgi:hypothetical protein